MILPLIMALVLFGLMYVAITGRAIPLIRTPRAAMIAVLIVGMAACTFGIGQVAASGRWLSPVAILGYLFGAALLVLLISLIAGWKLPFIASERDAMLAVGGPLSAKFVIGILSYLFHLA
jgi:hypothetical protein